MKYSLFITDVLVRWLEEHVRKGSIVQLDVNPDITDSDNLQLNLNVIFYPIPVKRKKRGQKVDYYVGCTGARIEVTTQDGKIYNHTKAVKIDVNYTSEHTRKQMRSMKLMPVISVEQEAAKFQVEGVGVAYEAGKEIKYSCAYHGTERILTPMYFRKGIGWDFTLPDGPKVVQDFVSGNLYLFAEISWPGEAKIGEITLRPNDWRFFNDKRRAFSEESSLAMRFAMWQVGQQFYYEDGVYAKFRLEYQQ